MAQEVQSNIQLVNTYSQILKSPRILDEVAKKIINIHLMKLITCYLLMLNQIHKY